MMGTKKYLHRLQSQTGDTIVEVLLCLGVLGLVVGTASVLASRNTKTLQTTKEDSVALRLAQSQIEYLKAYAATGDTNWNSLSSGTICMQNSTTQLPGNNAGCTYTSPTEGADYKQNITLAKSADGSYIVATATVSWGTLNADVDKTEVSYKIYKEISPDEDRRSGSGCPEGEIGAPPDCTKVPPEVRVKVYKIKPAANQTTPDCSSTSYEDRSAIGVRLQGGSYNVTKPTGSTSEASFQDAAKIVPGTNYAATITSVPTGFEICNGTAQTGALSATGSIFPVTPKLTVRPKCGTEPRVTAPYAHYTAPYDHYSALYAHYTAPYDHGSWAAWWDHQGPDRRIAGVGNNSFNQQEGSVTAQYRARPDLGGSPMFFERWVWITQWVSTGYYGDYLGTYADYLGYYADYLGTYGDPYTANVCPS
jgi:type II secretory pathway pseudopilin PulG